MFAIYIYELGRGAEASNTVYLLWRCRVLDSIFGIPPQKLFVPTELTLALFLCFSIPSFVKLYNKNHLNIILELSCQKLLPDFEFTSWFLSSLLCFVGGQTLLPHPRTTTGCCCTADLRAGYVSRPALAHASNFKLEKTQVNHSAPIAVLFNISSIKVCSKIIFRFVVKGINTPPPPLL